jgi:TonB family protein
VRRAAGRVMDAEAAAKRAAAASPALQDPARPYSLDGPRRGRLWGHASPNAELVIYADALARKIQFNTPFDTVRELAKRPHADPLVTLAIRKDGSVESVKIEVSSGSAELDDAIRRIVESNAAYAAFTPALAREYDVVEIRRTWYFDAAVRLH